MIPSRLRTFFWDLDIDAFDPQAHPEFTIGRILELGTPEAISWLESHFSEEQIRSVVRADSRLSPKSATFWALVYKIPPENVAGLR